MFGKSVSTISTCTFTVYSNVVIMERVSMVAECECHGHADSCHYDRTLQHGVCNNCTHNTTGHMCEECKDGFVRDTTKPLSATDGCIGKVIIQSKVTVNLEKLNFPAGGG